MGECGQRVVLFRGDCMSMTPGDVTRLLSALRDGQQNAISELLPLVYKDLRAIAANHLRGERAGHTLQPTALINEAYLQLVKHGNAQFHDRLHFFALASTLMRNILVDHARKRKAVKRGSGRESIPLDQVAIAAERQPERFLALNQALSRFTERDAKRSRMVELHYFGGLTYKEIAKLHGLSSKTIQRSIEFAESWLRAELSSRNPNESATVGADLSDI